MATHLSAGVGKIFFIKKNLFARHSVWVRSSESQTKTIAKVYPSVLVVVIARIEKLFNGLISLGSFKATSPIVLYNLDLKYGYFDEH